MTQQWKSTPVEDTCVLCGKKLDTSNCTIVTDTCTDCLTEAYNSHREVECDTTH